MKEFLIIAGLILLNGVLAMSEIALISVRKSYLANEEKKGNRWARLALRLANQPDTFLSTIQIGITIVGILTGIYSGSILADNFAVILTGWGVSASYAHTVAQTIIVVLVTYFTLIFGELVPKRIGMSIAEKVVSIVIRPMYLLSVIASPFVWLLAKSTGFVFDLFGLRTDSGKVTEEEIKSMIEEGAKGGEVQEVEQDIMERVFMLGDLKVSSLMTHRSDIIYLDIKMRGAEIKKMLQNDLHEVYPVVDGNLDNVKGIVELKDFVFRLEEERFNLQEVLKEAVYFHESMNVYKALDRMKEQRISQALICDEFGSCQGIISLEDILGGLVGTIQNSYEEPDIVMRENNEGWFVDGQCSIYDFLSYFEKEYLFSNKIGFETVGGLVLEQLQRIPATGDRIVWTEFELEIVDMDGARIDKILVTLAR